jgi:hypothetical protein
VLAAQAAMGRVVAAGMGAAVDPLVVKNSQTVHLVELGVTSSVAQLSLSASLLLAPPREVPAHGVLQ